VTEVFKVINMSSGANSEGPYSLQSQMYTGRYLASRATYSS